MGKRVESLWVERLLSLCSRGEGAKNWSQKGREGKRKKVEGVTLISQSRKPGDLVSDNEFKV